MERRRVLVGAGLAVAGLFVVAAALFLLPFLVDRRFEAILPGTAAAEIESRFGRPDHIETVTPSAGASVAFNGCGTSDRECWYYLPRIGRDRFVCFDGKRQVTCQGTALIWH